MHCRLVLLGSPAAGKGTQAEFLKERFSFDAPSVGGMLREQKAAGTPAGLKAAEYFERGLLAPDEITISVVQQWLAGSGSAWALDGFPRTVRQAEALDEGLAVASARLDFALLIEAGEPVIRDRVAHRIGCSRCGRIFRLGVHIEADSGPCPRCGAALVRRKDDNVDALADRLIEYRTKTAPVISYYETRGTLRRIDGERPPDIVFSDIAAVLGLQPAGDAAN